MKRPILLTALFLALPAVLCAVTLFSSYLPIRTWWVELLGYFIPLVLVTGLALMITVVLVRPERRYWWLPVAAFVLATKPWSETLRWNTSDPDAPHDVSVMSFNAALFNPYRPFTLESDEHLFDAFYGYLRNNPSPDVLCIQEFFHSAQDQNAMTADSIVKLGGYSYFYTNPQYDEDYGGVIGVMTFSKFPAVGNGRMAFGDSGVYNGSWVDFAIRGDTVRVFNMQLRSMSIRWRPHYGVVPNVRSIYHRLLMGYEARNVELAAVERYLGASPHPAVVCADINALPYSSTYQRLSERYDNAFEERGFGFGFTYRNFPWFVRIDNQFFDPRLDVTSFETLPDINISDHYPVVARYALGKGR